MFDWDDLRIFLAAARAGSLASAGQRLSIDTATVGRRIARLETALKSTLLIRSRIGLQLTTAGVELMATAVEAEAAMERAAEQAQADLVAGTVRVSASEGFGTVILAPALPALRSQRENLRVELAANSGFLSATTREVDMAITLSAPDAQRLIVEPLTKYQLALYAAPAYLEAHEAPRSREALLEHQIVGYVADLIYAPELKYLEEILPGLRPTLASTSIQAQREMVIHGGGIGVLPCFMADGLMRVLGGDVLLERRFWLSTHAEVHRTARMRAVHGWLKDLVERAQDRLKPF